MTILNSLDLDLVIVFAATVVTALIARRTQVPITALEIVAGIVLVALWRFNLPPETDSILALGGLFIVFLAGFETGLGFLRANWRRALLVGLPGFLGPFVGLFLLFDLGIHAPLLISLIGATVLADTSISITYTTLQQYDLADLPFGRLVLASTLCVNLAEDATVTSATFATTPGFLFTLGVLGALGVAAYLLPRISVAAQGGDGTHFTNIGARTLLFSLAILALLSGLVGVPGILFVFLMGLLLSELLPPAQWRAYLEKVRPLAFALFIPVYFLAVGLKVDPGFVIGHAALLLVLVAAATALRVAALYPVVRSVFGARRTAPIVTLMNTRLTSATVILTLTLGLGLIPIGWYSLLVTAVVVLALVSSTALRAFPAFGSVAAARALFTPGPKELAAGTPEPPNLPADRPVSRPG